MTNNIPQTQPILFKDILKKENSKGRILFASVLQIENVVPNIGAESSSFYNNESPQTELLTPEEQADIAKMEEAEEEIERMEASGLLDKDED